MGTGEESTPAKPSKPTSSAQETPATPSYPDWSSSMQAYYGAGAGAAPPFFATPVASPTPHPYLWGGQAPSIGQTNVDMEGKASDGKGRASNKKSKGSPGNNGLIASKGGESGKVASGSGNDGTTQSAESGSEGSSDTSDENNNQQEYAASARKKGRFDQMLADGANAQNNTAGANFQALVPGNPVVSVPATNLNIGMDLWSSSPAGAGAVKMRPNSSSGALPGVGPAAMAGREGMMGDQWIQVRSLAVI
ncbi:hypothetical protein Acr_05g0000410 [Actinidia rufa]|uniref:G-box binding protein multifunctional mosaic region domain-containing protein n=1 Tax=Actinidia rufa TaxID=165716 RepID=A0A7J0EJD8_9ERIC|nr:hypothetical protein Acr_05g0000410 [Actinidia rufa]